MRILFVWMCCMFAIKTCFCSLEPRTYNFEEECRSGFDFQTSSYIGVDEQIRIKTNSLGNGPYLTSCSYTLRSAPGDRFMFYFEVLNMEDCADDFLTFYDGDSNSLSRIGERKYCGQDKPYDVFVSSTNEMNIRFQSDGYLGEGAGFDIVVTVFHEGSCASFETECDNRRCIHGDLNCNGYNPCGDFSDCDGGDSEGSYLGIIIGGATSVFVVIVVVVTVLMYLTIRRRRSPGKQGHVEHVPSPNPVFQTLSLDGPMPDSTYSGEPVQDTSHKC